MSFAIIGILTLTALAVRFVILLAVTEKSAALGFSGSIPTLIIGVSLTSFF